MRTARARKQAAAQARVAKQDMWRVILALLIVVIAISTTFNAVTVALPKLFAERLEFTKSPALLGVIAACVYVFGAMTQYTIGKLLDRHSLKTVALPLSFVLAPFLYLAATLSNLPLILVSIGIVMGAFGQVTVNDAMVGKYTSEEWRSRAYAVRYFVGFTAAGASVGLVAWLYEQGGFVTMLHAFGGLCLLAIVAALILPREITDTCRADRIDLRLRRGLGGGRALFFSRAPVLEALHHDEERRHEQHRKAGRGQHAGEHGDADRLARVGAGAGREHQRHHAEDEGERRHQDRAEARARRLDRGFHDRLAVASCSSSATSTIRIAFLADSAISRIRPIWT